MTELDKLQATLRNTGVTGFHVSLDEEAVQRDRPTSEQVAAEVNRMWDGLLRGDCENLDFKDSRMSPGAREKMAAQNAEARDTFENQLRQWRDEYNG